MPLAALNPGPHPKNDTILEHNANKDLNPDELKRAEESASQKKPNALTKEKKNPKEKTRGRARRERSAKWIRHAWMASREEGSSPQGVRSGNWRDNSGESPMISTAADPVRPESPPPLSYFVPRRLGYGGTAHCENARLPLSLGSFTAPKYQELEDFMETDLLEGPGSDHERTNIDARPALSQGTETRAIPPLPINPATDAPPPVALLIDPEVILAPPLASEGSEASYRPQQDPPPPGCHENLAAAEKNQYYSSGHPVPRFRTMSHNLWVIAEGDISIIIRASMAGGRSTVVGDQTF
ncbi:hypothetical protein B9Z19DRAFT_1135955 [Tuber borchii]|uniref:Uncharacterized protein n=1 Tax=Tuber borchii TaxID=42251 RepID=A0A2T6ZC34_TUBBO|nr:hypothetical protein B9Z19DRAFT_1135955 [Tuber borchii]